MEAAGGWVCQSGLSEAVVVKGLTADPEADSATRIGWKFGCSRGVTGTPTFFGETSQPTNRDRGGERGLTTSRVYWRACLLVWLLQ